MSKGSKASLGCLFWIALILLVVVLFILNQDNITALIKRIKGEEKSKPDSRTIVITHGSENSSSQNSKTQTSSSQSQDSSKSSSSEAVFSSSTSQKSSSQSSNESKKLVKNLNLYFVKVNNNDQIIITGVTRQIGYKDTPLTETLKALLEGPSEKEKRSALQSMIPKGTKIKNVYIKGSTAYINFSEDFRFNSYGLPGLEAQVKQIVYTATEFPNVKQVQILIDDKKVDYLAQEGVYIGSPLSRNSF